LAWSVQPQSRVAVQCRPLRNDARPAFVGSYPEGMPSGLGHRLADRSNRDLLPSRWDRLSTVGYSVLTSTPSVSRAAGERSPVTKPHRTAPFRTVLATRAREQQKGRNPATGAELRPLLADSLLACHAGGRGFESRRSRSKLCLQTGGAAITFLA
jgi:hypothetical protein